MNIKENILVAADSLFHRFGIRSVSMDDIAREVSISKKTIYQHFKDKDEIVYDVSLRSLEEDKASFAKVHEQAENALDEMVKLSICIKENTEELNPSLLFDLQKYHPRSWKLWEDYKYGFIRDMVLSGISRGKKEGFFREDVDDELMANFRIETIEMTFDQRIFPKEKFNFMQVHLELFKHFVYGLMTSKGHDEFEKLLKTI